MDPATFQTIANGVLAILTPVLVKVIGTATKSIGSVAEELVETVGQMAGEKAARLLKALTEKLQGNQAAEEAMSDYVATPEDEDVQAALRLQMKKAMKIDESFARILDELCQEDDESGSVAGVTVTASGDRSVAAGRDIKGTVITGDIQGSHVRIGN